MATALNSESIDDIPLSELYMPFESLGNNCEFGIIQRNNGYDPPGLFRNVGYDYVDAMIRAISNNLEGMFDEGNYKFTRVEGWLDWRLDCLSYGFLFHTAISPDIGPDSPEWQKKSKDIVATFRFLKRLFQDDLSAGDKTFVFRAIPPITQDQQDRFVEAIRKHGPGWLLYIRPDPAFPQGNVEYIQEGLLLGAIDRLSNENPPIINANAWETIARKTIAIRETSTPL